MRFAHDSERLFAELLDYYEVAWEYEPVEFVLAWGPDGQPTSAFRPDFYLCEHDLFLELTTLRQELVTVKNRKLRQMAELYPEVQREGPLPARCASACWESTCRKQRLDWPGDPQTLPSVCRARRARRQACRLRRLGDAAVVPAKAPSPSTSPVRNDAAVFDVSHLGTVRVERPGLASSCCRRASPTTSTRSGPGHAQYQHLLDEDDASVLDDIIVWWVGEDRFDVMPNASNTDQGDLGPRAATT